MDFYKYNDNGTPIFSSKRRAPPTSSGRVDGLEMEIFQVTQFSNNINGLLIGLFSL